MGIDPVPRIDVPIEANILDDLYNKFAEFRKAYDEDGMTIDEFERYGSRPVEHYGVLLTVISNYSKGRGPRPRVACTVSRWRWWARWPGSETSG